MIGEITRLTDPPEKYDREWTRALLYDLEAAFERIRRAVDVDLDPHVLGDQAANKIFAGPSSGASAAPTFRSTVKADLPAAVAYEDEVNVFTADQEISKTRPEWRFITGGSRKGRFFSSAVDFVELAFNLSFDGTNWNLDDTVKGGGVFTINDDDVVWRTASAGTNPRTLTEILRIQDLGGVKFPATQIANTDANALDDYEEGNWTPNDASGAGLTLTVGTANYVKIGRLVIAGASVTYPSTADTSQAIIGGLPFTSESLANSQWGGFPTYTDFDNSFTLLQDQNGTVARGYRRTGGNVQNVDLSTKALRFVVVYRAAN